MGESSAVGAVGGERVVDVHNLEDSGFEGDGVAAKAVGITAAVHFFVMVANDRENGAKRFVGSADLFAKNGMLAHDFCFGGIQRTRLLKDTFGHGNFADIVKPAGDAQFESVFIAQAEASGE